MIDWLATAAACPACGHDPHAGIQMVMSGVCPDCSTCGEPFCPTCRYRKDLHVQDGRCPTEAEAQEAWGR